MATSDRAGSLVLVSADLRLAMMEYLAQGSRRLVCIEHHAHGFPDASLQHAPVLAKPVSGIIGSNIGIVERRGRAWTPTASIRSYISSVVSRCPTPRPCSAR